MPLLFDEDYVKLQERGFAYDEPGGTRFFIFKAHRLPDGLYTVAVCDVLVEIPANYNQAGNDMLWTYPRLHRKDGKAIPATNEAGNDSRHCDGRDFCRWSRHWNPGTKGAWRPGQDDIISIYRRIEWALSMPDAQ